MLFVMRDSLEMTAFTSVCAAQVDCESVLHSCSQRLSKVLMSLPAEGSRRGSNGRQGGVCAFSVQQVW